MSFWKGKKVLVTGGTGFVGSFLVEQLIKMGVAPSDVRIPRSSDWDLRIWDNCVRAVKDMDLVIHLAARVGGIGFNRNNPATLFYDNIIMGTQLIEASRQIGLEKFVAVGTCCSYPKYTQVPFKEEHFWDGYPEETNAPYGLAKKMLLVQSQAYRQQYGLRSIYLVPANMYGPRDNFDLETSHVIPALVRRCIEAKREGKKELLVWGTGNPSREFLYVEDCVKAILLAAELYDDSEPVNIGTGHEIKIRNLVDMITKLVGFQGKIVWDTSMPDGQPRRALDTRLAEEKFGFSALIPLELGLKKTVDWYNAR